MIPVISLIFRRNWMSKKNFNFLWYCIILTLFASCKGNNQSRETRAPVKLIESDGRRGDQNLGVQVLHMHNAPNNITRNIIEDKTGDIWFATFGGIIKYDGSVFTDVTKDVSQGRFFSLLEDKLGQLWFGSIGSGVFRYDGHAFQNFTTDDGLLNNEVVCIYEDRDGHIWFGVNGGVSHYNGHSFLNYMMDGDTMIEVSNGIHFPNMHRPPNEVNSIIEDRTGKYWIATRGSTFTFDGQSFKTVTFNNRNFYNVRCIIEDHSGHIWFGGNDGLWRFDGHQFKKYTENFVGYIYEDTNHNIWTSSQSATDWSLLRYANTSLDDLQVKADEIKTGEEMFFGILEDSNGSIWSGTIGGVFRYDDNQMTQIIRKE